MITMRREKKMQKEKNSHKMQEKTIVSCQKFLYRNAQENRIFCFVLFAFHVGTARRVNNNKKKIIKEMVLDCAHKIDLLQITAV